MVGENKRSWSEHTTLLLKQLVPILKGISTSALLTGILISIDYSSVQSDQELFDCVLPVLFVKSSTVLCRMCLLNSQWQGLRSELTAFIHGVFSADTLTDCTVYVQNDRFLHMNASQVNIT